MNFKRKIYYNNKALILTTNSNEYGAAKSLPKGYLLLNGASKKTYLQAIAYMDQQDTHGAIITDTSEKALIKELQALYKPIEAGGGVVFNEAREVLMIYRRGKWDLPKGKRDDEEDIETCALREVSEETGLQQLRLRDKIYDTYHIYSQNNKNLLKHTYWYSMQGTKKDKLEPQEEENIQEVRWVTADMLPVLLSKTYEAIKEVLVAAGVTVA